MQCGGWELKGPGQHARELMTVTRGPATAVKGAVKEKKNNKENAKKPACAIPSRGQDGEVER